MRAASIYLLARVRHFSTVIEDHTLSLVEELCLTISC